MSSTTVFEFSKNKDIHIPLDVYLSILKETEDYILSILDGHSALSMPVNQKWLAIARTHIEEGFMALSRALYDC